MIDYARTTPSVLFFDEFDAVAKERGDHHETGEIKRVVTSLLMQVDGLPSYTVTVAATNHPELLDRAVWRRFQLRLSLGAPTEKDLAGYLEKFGRSMGAGWGMPRPDWRPGWGRSAMPRPRSSASTCGDGSLWGWVATA